MDSLITGAARALAAGDPLGALNLVALRDDPPALALRGVAMAQLGDLIRARALLKRAARGFAPREALAHARCVLAEAEVALAARDLAGPGSQLDAARKTLEAHGDRENAAFARYLDVRRLLLIGRVDDAEGRLADLDSSRFRPALRAALELTAAGVAMRRLRTNDARRAIARARRAAAEARIPALIAEAEATAALLEAPAAQRISRGKQRLLRLAEVETLLASEVLVVDACRRAVRQSGKAISLATRPVLFALARALAEAWPGDAPRDALLARAFGAREADESHRSRLRVEIGRLRALLRPLARLTATKGGFSLSPRGARTVAVLAPPVEGENAAVLALLSDGESWSSSALALALGTSQRTVQRALDALAAAGRARSLGRARARRWMSAPVPEFTTTLLLPAPLPAD